MFHVKKKNQCLKAQLELVAYNAADTFVETVARKSICAEGRYFTECFTLVLSLSLCLWGGCDDHLFLGWSVC